jgi:hypothetical protein
VALAGPHDAAVTRWYHCVTQCVRRPFLLGAGDHQRRGRIERRLLELTEIFAVAVGGFAVHNNNFYIIISYVANS